MLVLDYADVFALMTTKLGSTGRLILDLSTIDLSTPSSSIIFALQLLTASHKQFREDSGGRGDP